jgi:hypothetical protein
MNRWISWWAGNERIKWAPLNLLRWEYMRR